MIVLLGKSCSGKSTIQSELIKLGIPSILEYTTRPPRENECNGKTYHFVTERKFLDLSKKSFFAIKRSFKVHNGEIWHYGIALQDLSDKKVIVTNPGCFHILKKSTEVHPVVFYIKTNENIIWNRLLARNDNIDEAQRRLIADREDFKEVEGIADYIIENDGLESPKKLARLIQDIYKNTI